MIFGNPPIVTNGLILNLDAANFKSYPKTGNIWYDLSGNNNTGSLTATGSGTPPVYSPNVGGSIVFNAINNYVNLGTPSSLNLTSQYTISAWVKLNSLPLTGNLYTIYDKGDAFNTQIYFRFYKDTVSTCQLQIGTYRLSPESNVVASYNIMSYTLFKDNQWNYLTGYFSGTVYGLNINGINASEINSSTIYSSAFGSFIGSAYIFTKYDRFINGSIANISVYNRALATREIIQNYNALKSRFDL